MSRAPKIPSCSATRDWVMASRETRLEPEVIYRVDTSIVDSAANAFFCDWIKYFADDNVEDADYKMLREPQEMDASHRDYLKKVCFWDDCADLMFSGFHCAQSGVETSGSFYDIFTISPFPTTRIVNRAVISSSTSAASTS